MKRRWQDSGPIVQGRRIASSQGNEASLVAQAIDGFTGPAGFALQNLAGFEFFDLTEKALSIGPTLERVRQVAERWAHESIGAPKQKVEKFLGARFHTPNDKALQNLFNQ